MSRPIWNYCIVSTRLHDLCYNVMGPVYSIDDSSVDLHSSAQMAWVIRDTAVRTCGVADDKSDVLCSVDAAVAVGAERAIRIDRSRPPRAP